MRCRMGVTRRGPGRSVVYWRRRHREMNGEGMVLVCGLRCQMVGSGVCLKGRVRDPVIDNICGGYDKIHVFKVTGVERKYHR